MDQQTNITTLSDQYVVDLTKPWHVSWWSKQLGVSEERLQEAVAVMGQRAGLVRFYLDQQEQHQPEQGSACTARARHKRR
jgi:uncharacterized protein DUF3606